MDYILSKEDIEQMEKLISISESVLDSYRLLAKLEIEDKCSTQEYISVLECLEASRSLESKLLEDITSDSKRSAAAFEYLGQAANLKSGNEIFPVVTTFVEQNLTKYRILKKLSNALTSRKEGVKEIIPPEFQKMFAILDIKEEMKELQNEIKEIFIYEKVISIDSMSFVLSKLQSKINSPFFKDIKNELINAKYRLIFLNEDATDLFKEDSKTIDIPSEIFFSGEFYTKFNKLDINLFNSMKKWFGFDSIIKQSALLLELKDEDYQQESIKVESEIREILLRLFLQFMDVTGIEITNTALHEHLDEEGLDASISAEKIISAYKQYNKDKASIRKISLKG